MSAENAVNSETHGELGAAAPPGDGRSPVQDEMGRAVARAAPVLIVSSVMFTFISYWRTAAVVLCDMSSTVFYIGAIVESAIGKAAPWFIIAVLLFSYAMRAVYIESSALFVRGGVYRVVKEAMGGFLAKLSVSALLFDYVLTGPISGVSAGQYICGLALEAIGRFTNIHLDDASRDAIKSAGSVLIACLITLYFFRQNLLGIPESSDKALKIMIATTIMGVILLLWSLVTLAARGTVNEVPSWKPDLAKKVTLDESGQEMPKINSLTGEQEDPLGFLGKWLPQDWSAALRQPANWLSLVGLIGLAIAFGHSILAMSGEETLAQVYREVEAPKLPNFKKAAFVVFLYSLLLTGTMNLIASLLIPDQQRMGEYYDNWMGGLAMQLIGPVGLRLLLNAFVVVVGFLILAGAANTSIIGSNGVLSRVAEDGVLPDGFLKPHPRYGTTSRILWLITGLQLFVIVLSRGDVILLGEAYAFGVVWSFVFKTLSMMVLRFKDRTPREFKVPFNVRFRGIELPVGLGLICLVVFLSALANFFTKQVATISGLLFTAAFLGVFIASERYHERRRRGSKHEHLEQFNQQLTPEATPAGLGLTKPYRKLVAIRSPQNLFMLERALAETDPETTDVVVMTAKVVSADGKLETQWLDLDPYEQHLMTAVVDRAERAGKHVVPLVVPTNNALHAVLKTAQDLQAAEIVLGASNKFSAEEQLDQVALYWISAHGGHAPPLTVRVLSRDRDIHFDLEGGNRIPTMSQRQARSVAELRAAGAGTNRVLLTHDGTQSGSDLFDVVMTMLDPAVALDLVTVPAGDVAVPARVSTLPRDQERARQIGREMKVLSTESDPGRELVRWAGEGRYDLIIVGLPQEQPFVKPVAWPDWVMSVLSHAHCRVLVTAGPPVPMGVADDPKTANAGGGRGVG